MTFPFFSETPSATAAIQAVRACDPAAVRIADREFAIAAFERHLGWATNPTVEWLTGPSGAPWFVAAADGWDAKGPTMTESACAGPVLALAHCLARLDHACVIPDDLVWHAEQGWSLLRDGAVVAQAHPLKFGAVDPILLKRSERVFRGLKRYDKHRAVQRLRDLPALSACRAPAEVAEPRTGHQRATAALQLAFAPGASAASLVGFAAEFGVKLTPAQARDMFARMWGCGDWHVLSARWKAAPAPCPHALHHHERLVGVARDLNEGVALLEMYAREQGSSWRSHHQIEVNDGLSTQLAPHVVLHDTRREPEFGTLSFDVTLAPLEIAQPHDGYIMRAKESWMDATDRERAVAAVCGVGQPVAEALANAEARVGFDATLTIRNKRFARQGAWSANPEAKRGHFTVCELDAHGRPTLPSKDLDCLPWEVSAGGSLHSAEWHFDGRSLSICVDYGRRTACRIEGITQEDAGQLASFLGCPEMLFQFPVMPGEERKLHIGKRPDAAVRRAASKR